MPLNKLHYSPNVEDRKVKQHFHPIYKMSCPVKKEFDRIEDLLDEICVDTVNGIPNSEIILKLTDKNQTHYNNQTKAVTVKTAKEYLKAVESRLALDRRRDIDAVKDSLYAQYLNLYRECLEMGNHMTAKSVLDSLMKLYGLDKPINQTNVQINGNDDGKIEINFGFASEKNDE